eukprot:595345-Pyramimonas_sp.AAC.1
MRKRRRRSRRRKQEGGGGGGGGGGKGGAAPLAVRQPDMSSTLAPGAEHAQKVLYHTMRNAKIEGGRHVPLWAKIFPLNFGVSHCVLQRVLRVLSRMSQYR